MIFFELEENSGGRGLPARLPVGERILWQGSPSWRVLMRRMLHGGLMAAYFAVLIGWHASESLLRGASLMPVASAALFYAGLSLLPLAFSALYCWALQRTTVYTITDARVVMTCGVALSVSINIPFSKIRSASLKLYPGDAGDIPLQLMPDAHVTYFMVWPHARPWRMRDPEPMFRCVPDAENAARILSLALGATCAIQKPAAFMAPTLVAAE